MSTTNPPRSGSHGIMPSSGAPSFDYYKLAFPEREIKRIIDRQKQSQFQKSSNHHRGDIPDRFYMKIEGQDEVLYKHAFSQHVQVKARNASKKQRDTSFLVFDSERIEERIELGRPTHIGCYRNGEYHIV